MNRARVTSVAHATPFNHYGSLATNWLGSRLTRSRQTTDDTSNQRLICQQRGMLRGLLRADRENGCTFHARAQGSLYREAIKIPACFVLSFLNPGNGSLETRFFCFRSALPP